MALVELSSPLELGPDHGCGRFRRRLAQRAAGGRSFFAAARYAQRTLDRARHGAGGSHEPLRLSTFYHAGTRSAGATRDSIRRGAGNRAVDSRFARDHVLGPLASRSQRAMADAPATATSRRWLSTSGLGAMRRRVSSRITNIAHTTRASTAASPITKTTPSMSSTSVPYGRRTLPQAPGTPFPGACGESSDRSTRRSVGSRCPIAKTPHPSIAISLTGYPTAKDRLGPSSHS